MDSIREDKLVAEFVGLQSGVQLASQFLKINEKELILKN
jgi:hypothetical protein